MRDDDPEQDLAEARAFTCEALSNAIKNVLTGFPAPIQGAVLANLTSLWLAGHRVVGDREATAAVRDDMLRRHVEAVCDMIPASEAEILAGVEVQGTA